MVVVVMTFVMVNLGFLMLFSCFTFVASFVDGFAIFSIFLLLDVVVFVGGGGNGGRGTIKLGMTLS